MINQRMCVSCRQRNQKCELIRISTLNNQAIVDNNKQCCGRAIYVCKTENCIKILQKSNAVKRFLQASTNQEFYDNLLKRGN